MLTPWKKSYDHPRQCIKKQYITLPTMVCQVKAVVFPLVLYGCESWTLSNTECQRIDAFQFVMLEKTLESPSACKEIQPVHDRGNQPWIFIGRTDWSWNSNTLTPWCEELTHLKRPWCWERLKAKGEGDDRGWDGWMASLSQWTRIWVNSKSWSWTGRLSML